MKYTGALKKPITKRRLSLLALADEHPLRAEYQRQTDEALSKLPDLFAAHDVQDGNWVALALALARTHVPGFKIVEPAGRPTEWEISDKAEFRLDVDAFIINSGNTLPVTEAIQRARRLDAWKSKTEAMKPAALRKHYDKADLRWVKLIQDAREHRNQLSATNDSQESIVPTN